MTSPLIIKAENITIARDKKIVLEEISFQINTGEIVVLLGSNGSGKSTILKAIAKILPFQKGNMQLFEKEFSSIDPKQASLWVSYTAQNNDFNLAFTVFDFVSLGRYPHKGMLPFMTNKDKDIINQALLTTNLLDKAQKNIGQLSGGEQQRSLLARALATEAPIMLLDEPTNSLDIKHQLEFFKLLYSLRNQGKTILIAIHNVNDALAIADKILLLHQGKIKYDGPASDALLISKLEECFQIKLTNKQNYNFELE
jgi:iron complex transport system ATP-binding protein